MDGDAMIPEKGSGKPRRIVDATVLKKGPGMTSKTTTRKQ